jgi:hypothetical protein
VEWLVRDKNTSFLREFVNYGCKKFHNIGLWLAKLKYLLVKNTLAY